MLKHVDNNDLEVIYVSVSDRILNSGSSKGNQVKWFKGNKFIKSNTWQWYEDVSEVLVSYLLRFTDIKYFVQYFPCKIIEGNNIFYGCYSYNFLKEDEQDIHFERLLKSKGISLSEASFDVVRDEISDIVGFDIKGYLGKCLCLDALTYNEDRHLNNLSVIRTPSGYREAPIYDNGLSCLADNFSYPFEDTVDENLMRVYAKPFNTDFLYQVSSNMINPISLDAEGFLNSVKPKTREEIRAFEVIKKGIRRSEGIVWERY